MESIHPVNVLYVNGGPMDFGGITSYMINYYRHFERSKVHIDFIVHGMEKGPREQEVLDLGSKVYHVPVKSRDYLGNIHRLRNIFQTGKYSIVHAHMDAMNGLVLKEAKKCGIPIRISHSHNTQYLTTNKFKLALDEIARKSISKYATHLFACSEPAGRWLYGDRLFNEGKVRIIHNAIDVAHFSFNEKIRKAKRKELGIGDQFVIGHVGRFDYQKNHEFLLDAFGELLKMKSDAVLALVGDGHLRPAIQHQIQNLGIQDQVRLLGQRNDVAQLLSAFDLFVLPSRFEGLGSVLVEAQASGLNCLASDAVPGEVNINQSCDFFSLLKGPSNWAEKMKVMSEIKGSRLINRNTFVAKGYEIDNEATQLEKMYINLSENLISHNISW